MGDDKGESHTNDKQERILYLDVIRVVAMIAVMMIHCAAENWYKLDGRGFQWQVLNAYDSMVRFAVPVFVMLTGATMGNPAKKLDIGTLWKKHILRLAIAYRMWYGICFIFFPIAACAVSSWRLSLRASSRLKTYCAPPGAIYGFFL